MTTPDEDAARALLARAAATIDVDEAVPVTLTGLPEPRPHRWPVVAAAAAVVLAIGGGLLVAQQLGDDQRHAPPAVDRPTGQRTADEAGVELPDDVVPGLIGYTQGEATRLLERRGLSVQVQAQPEGCNVPGMVTGSDPAVGTPVEPGDTVTIRVITQRDVIDCVGEVTWQPFWDLVRLARGTSDDAHLADEVELSLGYDATPSGGEVDETRTRDELADPGAWVLCGADGVCHSALGALAQMVTQAWSPFPSHYYASPFPSGRWATRQQAGFPVCRGSRVEGFSLEYWVEVPTDGFFCPPTTILVGTDEEGRIDRIRLQTPEALETDELEPTLDRLRAAQQFEAWARGEGPAPAFAEEVRRLVGGTEVGTPLTDPEDPDAWRIECPETMSMPCPPSAVDLLRAHDGDVAKSTTLARGCAAHPDALPDDLRSAAADDLVRLDDPEPRDCSEGWAVELWIDDSGVVYAVDQVGSAG